mmetsp:Transcript_113984/g.159908  ORF Transcript_113984/g.159908 Transcript_113984/m.159908 type:complete len:261 (+) Transcript_113984:517-1299(+)
MAAVAVNLNVDHGGDVDRLSIVVLPHLWHGDAGDGAVREEHEDLDAALHEHLHEEALACEVRRRELYVLAARQVAELGVVVDQLRAGEGPVRDRYGMGVGGEAEEVERVLHGLVVLQLGHGRLQARLQLAVGLTQAAQLLLVRGAGLVHLQLLLRLPVGLLRAAGLGQHQRDLLLQRLGHVRGHRRGVAQEVGHAHPRLAVAVAHRRGGGNVDALVLLLEPHTPRAGPLVGAGGLRLPAGGARLARALARSFLGVHVWGL